MANKVLVKVLFFAKAKEVTKQAEAYIQVPAETRLEQVLQVLEKTFPELVILQRTFALALNEEYMEQDLSLVLQLSSTDVLAVIPPISGG
jgi:molybdopterin converting factor subunit 1